jgi:hypothetical protein
MATVTFKHVYVSRANDGTKLVTLRWPPVKGFPGIPTEELDALYEVVLELARHKEDIRDLVVASIEQTGKARNWRLVRKTGYRRWKDDAAERLRQELGEKAFTVVPKTPDAIIAEFGPNVVPLVNELTTGGEPIAYVTRGGDTHVKVMK